MILKPLLFVWEFNNNTVKFTVSQNPEHILYEKYYGRGCIPPLSEKVKYYTMAGKSSDFIKKLIKFDVSEKKNSEKNQEALDKIFLKFNVKPVKKRVLKSVKKF